MARKSFKVLWGFGSVLGAAALLGTACSGGAAPTPLAPALSVPSPAGALGQQLALRNDVRKLWEDHVTWTRLTIVCVGQGLPDTDATVQRLLQNQADIGNAIKPVYGDTAGDKLATLLKDHIAIAADILTAAKAGDSAKVEAARARWLANADDIAIFLSGANPDRWKFSEVQAALRAHLGLTLEEATAYLNKDWPNSIAAYDKVHQQILQVADILSSGIIAQFPQKFS